VKISVLPHHKTIKKNTKKKYKKNKKQKYTKLEKRTIVVLIFSLIQFF